MVSRKPKAALKTVAKPAPKPPPFRVQVFERTFVTTRRKLPQAAPNPISHTLAEIDPGDPRVTQLRRLETRLQASREEDRRVAARNSDLTRIDDPVSKVNSPALISTFDSDRSQHLNTLSRLFLAETASISSLEDVYTVIQTLIGESAEINEERAKTLITKLFEVKFIETLAETVSLDEATRRYLMRKHIDREWGPTNPPPVIVRTDTNSNQPRKQTPVALEKQRSGVRDAPKPASRGAPTIGPFGAIPTVK